MFDKLSSGRSPPKAVDPLQVLPLELLEMILQYLQFHHVMYVTPHSDRFGDETEQAIPAPFFASLKPGNISSSRY